MRLGQELVCPTPDLVNGTIEINKKIAWPTLRREADSDSLTRTPRPQELPALVHTSPRRH